MKINREHFAVVFGWMISELELKGTELLIYAIIYGYSQEENNTFRGSLQYLADWTGSTKQSVINNLKSLVEKGYIEKIERINNGVKFVEYSAKKFTSGQKILMGGQKILIGGSKNFNGGSQKSLPVPLYNINDNIDDNIEDNIECMGAAAPAPAKRSKFVPPTAEEVRAYSNEIGKPIDAEAFIDHFTSNGWKVGGKTPMKDWKAAVRQWRRRDEEKGKVYKGDGIDHSLDFMFPG